MEKFIFNPEDPDGRYCCCGKFKVVGDTEPTARVKMLTQLRIKGIVDFK